MTLLLHLQLERTDKQEQTRKHSKKTLSEIKKNTNSSHLGGKKLFLHQETKQGNLDPLHFADKLKLPQEAASGGEGGGEDPLH